MISVKEVGKTEKASFGTLIRRETVGSVDHRPIPATYTQEELDKLIDKHIFRAWRKRNGSV